MSEKLREIAENRLHRIMLEYGPALSRLAFAYEKEAGAGEELTQEIALAVRQALPHFRGECSERKFVYRIAHNRGLTRACRRQPVHATLEELPRHWSRWTRDRSRKSK